MRVPRFIFPVALFLIATNLFASQIPWESSFDAAKARAKLENKPILLLHVFGRLDQEFT